MKGQMFVLSMVIGSGIALAGCGNSSAAGNVPHAQTSINVKRAATTHNARSHGVSSSSRSASLAFVRKTMQLAKLGYAPGIPFRVGTGVDVQETWGNPTSQSAAGAGVYDTYSKHQTAIGLNQGDELFDVRSYRSDVRAVTMADVQMALGTDHEVRYFGKQTIWMYPAGPRYQLLWVFPNPTTSVSNPHADHISVFYPAATIDSMALNFPMPTVQVYEAPGLLTFSIRNHPPGYSLQEFEWIGSGNHRHVVVQTYEQAVRNGAIGGPTPNFEVSGDGQTLSFVYGSQMSGERGQVHLIFQNTNGSAVIAQSPHILLK